MNDTERREQIIDSAVDMFDIVNEVVERVNSEAMYNAPVTKICRDEAYQLIDLALKAEQNRVLRGVETSLDNM